MGFEFKNLYALSPSPKEPQATPEEALSQLLALKEKPPADQMRVALKHFTEALTRMDEVSRELVREEAVAHLRGLGFASPARIVEAAMPPGRSDDGKRNGTGLQEPEIWPEPVEGAVLLTAMEQTLARFLALGPEQFAACALWILFAHAHDAFEISPILSFTSPDKGCGKSTALALLSALVPKPLPSANITPSAVFRVTERYRPCLLLDEADTFLSDSEGLRGILNSGHMRSQAYVTRVMGDEYEVVTFSTWAPKAIAMIGDLPPTLADRSIPIRMRRRARNEVIERLQLHRLSEMEDLRSKAARWASDRLEGLRSWEPEIPEAIIRDRARDNWRPLLAVAEAAGGDWVSKARSSAVQLSTHSKGEASASIHLLEDLRALFQSRGAQRLSSEEILQHLHQMDERPWPEWRDRSKMTGRQLALLLLPFGIAPRKWKQDRVTVRGYDRDDLGDIFARYLPPEPPQAPPPSFQSTYSQTSNATGGIKVAVQEADKSNVFTVVAEVAVQKEPVSKKEVPS